MSDAPGGIRLAELLHLPVGERRMALKAAVSRSGVGAALRADIRAATSLGEHSSDTASLAPGWQDRLLGRLHESEMALDAEEHYAEELLAKVVNQPAQRRETLVRNSRKYHTWSLCRLLSKESLNTLFRDPQQGLELAKLATDIAEGQYLRVSSASLLNDLKASCWTYQGNAHRALGQFPEAELAFQRAHAYLRDGTGDPIESARLADFKALLRLRQSRPEEALRLFDHAIRTFLNIGDRHAAGISVIGKGALMLLTGKPLEAMRLNRRALEMIDPDRDPRLQNIVRHNLAVSLNDLGAYQEALDEIRKLKGAHAKLGDTISLIRVRNLEAEATFGLGDFEKATELLLQVRDDYAANGMALDVAIVTLELATYHLRLNQTAETKRLAAESLPYFRSLGIHREAIAAFLVFQQAAEREAATVELVREVAAFLRASRGNPELKFRG